MARALRFAMPPQAAGSGAAPGAPGAPDAPDELDALLERPRGAHALLVLAHGAGADMRHAFLESLAAALARHGVATFRYQFPYAQRGRRAPDRPPVLVASVRAALREAARAAPGLPLFAGGKSLGGRMTSTAAAESPLPDVRGLVFLGFPLHAPGRRGSARAAHLSDVPLPLLFVQGTRDRLAPLDELRPVTEGLGSRAALHVVEGGDHSFRVPRRSGRGDDEIHEEIAAAVADWCRPLA